MDMQFKKQSFGTRLKSMLRTDFMRMLKTPLIYIMCGICFAVPIAILVMTSMQETDGMETFTSVWQVISSLSGADSGTSMDLTSMCNMNMTYFAVGIFACLFISAEFRSGYAKNLFTYRAKKNDYVFSKTAVCTAAGMCMIVSFFLGAMAGGKISGLSFEKENFTALNLAACLISKLLLTGVFTAITVTLSVFAKQRTWVSVCLSLAAEMLLFMMISIMTPLNAGVMNVVLCLAGSILFSVGLGAVGNVILNKTNIL